jgi:deazaflavin-dependent oxidoreductase (nitroreductase family)
MREPRLVRWFFRLPVTLYRFGLADQLGRSTLLLTTRGRKSGLPRTTALNYVIDGDVTCVLSGSGPGSDWLRNLQANPNVLVQVGRRRFAALAECITDPVEHRRILTLWAEQSMRTAPPRLVQDALRRIGFDYEASIRKHLEEDPPPPLVSLSLARPALADEADTSTRPTALVDTRNSAIVAVKIVHSVIFVVESASVMVIFALGLTGSRSRGDIIRYDADAIGSAVYFGSWLKEAVACVRDNQAIFKQRPPWLFSSGPLGVGERYARLYRDAQPKQVATLLRTMTWSPRSVHLFGCTGRRKAWLRREGNRNAVSFLHTGG